MLTKGNFLLEFGFKHVNLHFQRGYFLNFFPLSLLIHLLCNKPIFPQVLSSDLLSSFILHPLTDRAYIIIFPIQAFITV